MNADPIKARLKLLALRINALQMRERVFLFIALIVSCLAVADTLWLTPTQNAYRQVTLRYASQADELRRLRTELQTSGVPADAGKAVRDQIADLDTRIAQVNEKVKTLAPLADEGPNLEQVLVQFLRRYPGLTLLSTGTLGQDGTVSSGVARRGMELRVAGSYAELTRYVLALEAALPTLRWGVMQIKSDKQPVELTLRVYVVGVQP